MAASSPGRVIDHVVNVAHGPGVKPPKCVCHGAGHFVVGPGNARNTTARRGCGPFTESATTRPRGLPTPR